MTEQGDLALLQDPVAQDLLASREYAQLAYVWHDGTPRVVPIWFHWTGERLVLATPPRAPKLTALRSNPHVAVTIDTNDWPAKALMIRGDAELELLDDVVPEYATATRRYFGDGATAWLDQMAGQPMARITVTPRWVGLIDFETRFPSSLSA
jgi:PPOX class probable F420-dependent enzyme